MAGMPTKAPISVLIPTRNEAANISACLASAAFCDEIVVVDSGSVDGTVEMARRVGAIVVDFKWNGHFPRKKNWALSNVPWKHEWLFILDADERITPELAREIVAEIERPRFDGYYVNRRFWFLNGWLNHCGYYPSWNLRFFRHRRGRYERLSDVENADSGDNEIHEHVQLEGTVGYLHSELHHFAFPDIATWVEKHNRYSSWEAAVEYAARRDHGAYVPSDSTLRRKRRLRRFARRLPFRPILRFCYHYVWRAGFLDGYRGYLFCRLLAYYEFLSRAKVVELQLRPPRRLAPGIRG